MTLKGGGICIRFFYIDRKLNLDLLPLAIELLGRLL